MRSLLFGAGLLSTLALGSAPGPPATPAEASVLSSGSGPGAWGLGVAPVAARPAEDTLRLQVRAGLPLITALPPRHQGRPASYRLVQAPALSWLVDRSFFWRTLPTESGTMPVLIRRVAPGVEPDTLVLMVRVTPA